MPHAALKLIPGVDQYRTPALNEAAISSCNLIRFVPDKQGLGLVQKLGGWTKFFPNYITSIVRALWAWEDTNANSYLAVGAESSLTYIYNGSQYGISPRILTDNVAVNIACTTGSSTFTITDTGSNITQYDSVYIKTPIAIGGTVLFGFYPCSNPTSSANTYKITAVDTLGFPVAATFSSSVATTGASGTGTNATITFAGGGIYPVGSKITVAGVTPTGYNGTYTVTVSSAGSVSYANATTGAQTVAGTITNTGQIVNFTTTSGSPTISVYLVNHGYSVGSTFPVLVSTTVGGTTLFGNYIVQGVTDDNNFTITSKNSATSSVSNSPMNSGNAQYFYYIGVGPTLVGAGYGIGGYGRGGYGSGLPVIPATGGEVTTSDWTLDNWGEILISCPLNGAIYTWSPVAGYSISTVIGTAPLINAGIVMAMPQRQIIAWGSTFTGIQDPLLIRWCDVNDFTVWAGSTTNQAGSYRIPKGSVIVQCIQGPQQTLVWTDLGLWAMQYVGQPYVYQFNEIGTGCGLIGRKAAGSLSGNVYWMGASQFYRLSAGGVELIPCPVWDVIFQDLDTAHLNNIRIAPNSRFGEVSWFYPTIGSNGENTNYVKYNILLNQWDYGTLSRTAWINESVLGPPIGAGFPIGQTSPNYIYQHETSTDADNQVLAANFQTGYFVLSEADWKIFIDQVWPDMKWGYYGGTQNANVQITFYATDYAGQTPLVYGPYNMTQATNYITPRLRGRLISVKVENVTAGDFWRIGNIRYRMQPSGKY